MLMLLGSLGITITVVGHLPVTQITAYYANYLTKKVNTTTTTEKMNVNFTPATSVFLSQVNDFLVALADAN
ncbi:hypothetical protein TYRP_000725 [Tyrophagus putrescentiae]|nr:hypothetical protein TYRP_000725 [Tyrophagus putrescentiae]